MHSSVIGVGPEDAAESPIGPRSTFKTFLQLLVRKLGQQLQSRAAGISRQRHGSRKRIVMVIELIPIGHRVDDGSDLLSSTSRATLILEQPHGVLLSHKMTSDHLDKVPLNESQMPEVVESTPEIVRVVFALCKRPVQLLVR
jgi:hypothetical protein